VTFLARRPAPIIIAALAALGAFLVLAAGPATADPSIASKREEAQAVLAQIRALDVFADEEELIARLTDVVNLDQVAVHAADQPVGLGPQRLDRSHVGHERCTQKRHHTEAIGALVSMRQKDLGPWITGQGLEEHHVAEGARKSSGSGDSCRPL